MGEKSNAILPYSQVIMHLCPNHAKMNGSYDDSNNCPICGQDIGKIDLPTQTHRGSNRLRANEVYYYAKAEFYEPVLIEPLTFTCGSEFNPPMWNLDNFELTYNINDYSNMLKINKALILSKLNRVEQKNGNGSGAEANKKEDLGLHDNQAGVFKCAYPSGTLKTAGQYVAEDDDTDKFVNEELWWSRIKDNIKITLKNKPKLVYYVYTPIPGNEPRLPYMAHYKEFKRYRYTASNTTINRRKLLKDYSDQKIPEMKFDTGRIDMVYYPHSIYLYVAEANDNRMSTPKSRMTHAETLCPN